MIPANSKYKIILRWLSIIPTIFTVVVLSDWLVRLMFWFARLPIIIFEKVTGFVGPIGKFMDSISNYFTGVGSIETITISATGLVTGYAVVYIISIVVPSNKKKTAKILLMILSFLLGLVFLLVARYLYFVGWTSFSGLMQARFAGGNVLLGIFLVIGIITAWNTIKKEPEKENDKYEKFISDNTIAIFISTLLFTLVMTTFFLR